MRNKETKINPLKTPHLKHIKFLKSLEKQSLKAYRYIMSVIIDDVVKLFDENYEPLRKSDDFPRGWTGEIPKIEIDIDDKLKKIIQKRLKAFEWLSVGGYADAEAIRSAKELGLVGKFTPGSVLAAYLHALDTERDYYKFITGEDAGVPAKLLRDTMEELVSKTRTQLELLMKQIENNIVQTVVAISESHNADIANRAKDPNFLEKLADRADKYIAATEAKNRLKEIIKTQEPQAYIGLQSDVSKGSSIGTHQAMYEIFGGDGGRIIFVTYEDERVCEVCTNFSKNKDGTYKEYTLSDFKPYGYNYKKKKKDWVLTIPPIHISCRCKTVMIPKGSIYKDGSFFFVKK